MAEKEEIEKEVNLAGLQFSLFSLFLPIGRAWAGHRRSAKASHPVRFDWQGELKFTVGNF